MRQDVTTNSDVNAEVYLTSGVIYQDSCRSGCAHLYCRLVDGCRPTPRTPTGPLTQSVLINPRSARDTYQPHSRRQHAYRLQFVQLTSRPVLSNVFHFNIVRCRMMSVCPSHAPMLCLNDYIYVGHRSRHF